AAGPGSVPPPYHPFDPGPLHGAALNPYAGTPERRPPSAIYVDAFDLHLGAPAVDNYGGYLGDEQLGWLEADLAAAAAAGKTIVGFGHHDPRGDGEAGQSARYAANLPFPSHPLSMGSVQEGRAD